MPSQLELDHLFICTEIDAPVAQKLRDFGLVEGSGNHHPGQGSANRRFFFNNFMLELLWVHDVSEAKGQPIDLGQRWQQRQAQCPFGVCLRPSARTPNAALPFSFWVYRPPYLPSSLSIPVANNTGNLAEPMLFYLAFAQRPDQLPAPKQQPLHHAYPLREVTRLCLTLPFLNRSSPGAQDTMPSAALQSLVGQQLVSLEPGEQYCVTLGFDGELQNQRTSFAPELPLVLSW